MDATKNLEKKILTQVAQNNPSLNHQREYTKNRKAM